MSVKKKENQIPFDVYGDQLYYVDKKNQYYEPLDSEGRCILETAIMKDNFIFEDTLTYVGLGWSAYGRPHFIFKRLDYSRVIMFTIDFDIIVHFLTQGKITGKFSFRKSGSNYGCYLVND